MSLKSARSKVRKIGRAIIGKTRKNSARVSRSFFSSESAYETCLRIRDGVHRDPWINAIITQGDGINEATAYSRDQKRAFFAVFAPIASAATWA